MCKAGVRRATGSPGLGLSANLTLRALTLASVAWAYVAYALQSSDPRPNWVYFSDLVGALAVIAAVLPMRSRSSRQYQASVTAWSLLAGVVFYAAIAPVMGLGEPGDPWTFVHAFALHLMLPAVLTVWSVCLGTPSLSFRSRIPWVLSFPLLYLGVILGAQLLGSSSRDVPYDFLDLGEFSPIVVTAFTIVLGGGLVVLSLLLDWLTRAVDTTRLGHENYKYKNADGD